MSNISNPAFVKEQEKKVKTREQREEDDLYSVLNTKQGRRFIWKWLSECGIFRAGFCTPDELMFREGARNVGTKLLAQIMKISPELFKLMQEESEEEK